MIAADVFGSCWTSRWQRVGRRVGHQTKTNIIHVASGVVIRSTCMLLYSLGFEFQHLRCASHLLACDNPCRPVLFLNGTRPCLTGSKRAQGMVQRATVWLTECGAIVGGVSSVPQRVCHGKPISAARACMRKLRWIVANAPRVCIGGMNHGQPDLSTW